MARAEAKYRITAVDRTARTFARIRARFAALNAQVTAMRAAFIGLATGIGLAFVKKLANADDRIAKLSRALQIPVERLSALEHAANISGSSFDALTAGFRRLSSVLDDASGDELLSAQRTFEKLGVSFDEIKSLRPDIAFLRIADAVKKVKGPFEQAALAQELFGRGGLQLVPLLQQGSEGIRKLMGDSDALGATLGKDAAKNAEDFNDAITRLIAALKPLGRFFVEILNPALESMVEMVKELNAGGGISKMLKARGHTKTAAIVDVFERGKESDVFQNALLSNRVNKAKIDAFFSGVGGGIGAMFERGSGGFGAGFGRAKAESLGESIRGIRSEFGLDQTAQGGGKGFMLVERIARATEETARNGLVATAAP